LSAMWFGLGIASVFALANPIRWSPIFVVQLLYKFIWLAFSGVPALMAGTLSRGNYIFLVIVMVYIVMDLLFIPWSHLRR